jgi:hypothetical protein
MEKGFGMILKMVSVGLCRLAQNLSSARGKEETEYRRPNDDRQVEEAVVPTAFSKSTGG